MNFIPRPLVGPAPSSKQFGRKLSKLIATMRKNEAQHQTNMSTNTSENNVELVTSWSAPESQSIIKPVCDLMKKHGVKRMHLVVIDEKLQWLLDPENQSLTLFEHEQAVKEMLAAREVKP